MGCTLEKYGANIRKDPSGYQYVLILSLLFVHLVLNVKILADYTYSELTNVVLPHTNGVFPIYSPYCLADHNSASAIQNAVGATECYGGSKGLTLRQIGLFSWCQVTTGTTFCLCYKYLDVVNEYCCRS